MILPCGTLILKQRRNLEYTQGRVGGPRPPAYPS